MHGFISANFLFLTWGELLCLSVDGCTDFLAVVKSNTVCMSVVPTVYLSSTYV